MSQQTRDGDPLPCAYCARHLHTRLTIEPTPHSVDWHCWCQDCADAAEDGVPRVIGYGETPWQALCDFAEGHDADPAELLEEGERHV